MYWPNTELLFDYYDTTLPQELYLIGGAYDVSPFSSTTGMNPMKEVEAFSPASPGMRQVYDLAPRSLAAGAVVGRRVYICGGTTWGEGWLNTCLYLDVDKRVCRQVRASSPEDETNLYNHQYLESCVGQHWYRAARLLMLPIETTDQ
jgi:hypothetical protein